MFTLKRITLFNTLLNMAIFSLNRDQNNMRKPVVTTKCL